MLDEEFEVEVQLGDLFASILNLRAQSFDFFDGRCKSLAQTADLSLCRGKFVATGSRFVIERSDLRPQGFGHSSKFFASAACSHSGGQFELIEHVESPSQTNRKVQMFGSRKKLLTPSK